MTSSTVSSPCAEPQTSSTWPQPLTFRCSSEPKATHIASNTPEFVLLLTSDSVVVRGATKAAQAADLEVATSSERREGPPAGIVIDLEQPGAIDMVAELRAANPDAILAGHVSRPEPERWIEAERAGCDVVANRGAIGRQLGVKLASRGEGRRRFPLVDDDDVAGRLGLVGRIEETPFGALGVYHVNGRVSAVDDTCPHSGATLSEGVVEGCVVTCPRHGSQFDVQTGERLRGPSDDELVSYEVVRESGRVQLVWSE